MVGGTRVRFTLSNNLHRTEHLSESLISSSFIINIRVIFFFDFLTAGLSNNKNIRETRTLRNHNTSLSRRFFALANHATLAQYSSERRENRPTELRC